MRFRAQWVVLCAGAIGCGTQNGQEGADEGPPTDQVRQAITGTISASPSPCVVAFGSQLCTTTISWTASDPSFNYQVFDRMDNGPYKYFGCTPAPNTSGSQSAPWIQPGHSYRFSLRATSSPCSTPDPWGVEVGSATVDGITATIQATATDTTFSPSILLVPSGGLATTNINWTATYGKNNVVWVSEFNGSTWSPYSNFACNLATQGASGSSTAPWIQAGHIYRFSLRPTPTSLPCETSDNTYPEVAAVSVQGFTDYLKPEQDRCSASSTGTCSTVLHWGSSSSAAFKKIEQSTNGTTWTQLACPSGSSGTVATGALTHDTKYSYRLRPVSACNNTTAPATATAYVHALSNVVVPSGTTLQLGGAPFRAMGMNKYDLFRQYIMKPDYQHPMTCSDPPSASDQVRAEQDMADLQAKGIQYLRIAGIGFYAYSPFTNPPYTDPFELQMWQTCPNTYWARFDSMLSAAQSRGLKLIVTLVHAQCMFPHLVHEHLGDLVKNPASQSRQKMLQYAQDLITRYKDNTTIQGWELVNELDSLMDLNLAAADICPYAETSADNYTSDDAAKFMSDFATAVRGWDSKHFITSGYTDFRPAQAHLRARPGFLPNGQPNPAIDWTPDDRNMFESLVQYLHPNPIDVIGMHEYNGDLNGDPNVPSDPERSNTRFGFSGFYNADVLDYLKVAADHARKPLFLGEYNDAWDCDVGGSCFFPADHRRNYARAVIQKITQLHIPLSTQWTWEMHDGPTWYSIVPGQDALTDEYIGLFQARKTTMQATSQAIDLVPDNAGFDLDGNGDGTPDSWTSSGPAIFSLVQDSYNGKAAKIAPTTSGLGILDTPQMMLGVYTPNPTLVASVAALTSTNIPDAAICVYAYSTISGGTPFAAACTPVTGDPNKFKVYSVSVPASGVKSAKVRLYGSSAGYVEFDDVRFMAAY